MQNRDFMQRAAARGVSPRDAFEYAQERAEEVALERYLAAPGSIKPEHVKKPGPGAFKRVERGAERLLGQGIDMPAEVPLQESLDRVIKEELDFFNQLMIQETQRAK